MDKSPSFAAWFEARYGCWPGHPGERYDVAFARLCDAVAVYVDEKVAALRETPDPNAALDTLAAEAQEAGEYDEVGDWRAYAEKVNDLHISRIARGFYYYVDAENAFHWSRTPQGFDFWERLALGNATPAEEARARGFARRVLEAMEKEDE